MTQTETQPPPPMTHTAFLATLPPDTRATLTRKSDARGLVHLGLHLGTIALTGLWIALSLPLWPLALVLHGVLVVFLFTLLHETVHKTPFASDGLNTGIGHACGFVLMIPAGWFRYFHLAHHRYTQIPGKDPELAEPKPETLRDYVLHVSGLPVWLGNIRALLGSALGAPLGAYVPRARTGAVRREARLYLAGYGALALLALLGAGPALMWLWLVPMLLGQPFLRLYLLAEHGRCPFVANMLENTRTTRTNRLVRALAWNMPYHTEHHSYPSVPFYNLPALHRLIAPHIRVMSDGYGAFTADYVRTLKPHD